MATRDVSIDILTGFLGSGKTTLLRHVLDRGLEGRKVAVVMNEIGDVGIDGRVIEGLNIERMIELGSGCVCCTINREFGLALQELIETVSPDVIIVETTGVADPANIASETRRAGLAVDATITVADAVNLERHLAASGTARDQIAAADFIVLSKTDLVDEGAAAEAEARLHEINPRALVMKSRFGRVPADVVFGAAPPGQRDQEDGRGGRHLDRDGIGSFVFESNRPFDRTRFESVIECLPETIYRAKGIVAFTESEWSCLFNYTCGRTEFEWRERVGEGFVGRSVFIGAGVESLADAISARLTDCLA